MVPVELASPPENVTPMLEPAGHDGSDAIGVAFAATVFAYDVVQGPVATLPLESTYTAQSPVTAVPPGGLTDTDPGVEGSTMHDDKPAASGRPAQITRM
jgi:hypothetical protein